MFIAYLINWSYKNPTVIKQNYNIYDKYIPLLSDITANLTALCVSVCLLTQLSCVVTSEGDIRRSDNIWQNKCPPLTFFNHPLSLSERHTHTCTRTHTHFFLPSTGKLSNTSVCISGRNSPCLITAMLIESQCEWCMGIGLSVTKWKWNSIKQPSR